MNWPLKKSVSIDYMTVTPLKIIVTEFEENQLIRYGDNYWFCSIRQFLMCVTNFQPAVAIYIRQ